MSNWNVKHTYRKGEDILCIGWGETWRWHPPEDLVWEEITITSELYDGEVLRDTYVVILRK